VLDVSGELSYKVEVVELPSGTFVLFLLKGIGERFVVCENCEMTCLQHVLEMAYSFVNCQEFLVVRAVLLLGRVSFWEKPRGCQALWTRWRTAPMAVEASVMSARGADVSGWARRVARDKFSLQSAKA
jgi:hypothetical protein